MHQNACNVKIPKLQRAISHETFFGIYSKKKKKKKKICISYFFPEFIQKLVRASTYQYQSIHQVLRHTLQQILRYFADKISSIFFSKDHNSGKGYNPDGKNMCTPFFHEVHKNEKKKKKKKKKTLACTVQKLCYASKSM